MGEYQELCAANEWNPAVGIDGPTFEYFVNTSDSGGYSSDEDMRRMLATLATLPGAKAPLVVGGRQVSSGTGGLKAGEWICPKCFDVQPAGTTACRKGQCDGEKATAKATTQEIRRTQGRARSRSQPRREKPSTTTGPGGMRITVEKMD